MIAMWDDEFGALELEGGRERVGGRHWGAVGEGCGMFGFGFGHGDGVGVMD